MDRSTAQFTIIKANAGRFDDAKDILAVEEPLEIRLSFGPAGDRTQKNISVTMRTPGNDAELSTGFLFTEGIINDPTDVLSIELALFACSENKQNTVVITLSENIYPAFQHLERNFYTTSSCGVCGKSSINAIKTVSRYTLNKAVPCQIDAGTLLELPSLLRRQQLAFEATGGLHACAFFSLEGKLLIVREDIGRHNALDKLIGAALGTDWLPLNQGVLMLSGRASFELIQKSAMAGIAIIAAVGAPSSLAVETANEFGITLIGFLREERFNIYTHSGRVLTRIYEDQN